METKSAENRLLEAIRGNAY